MVADTVTIRFYQFQNTKCVWTMIQRATAEEHVVIHVFSDTLVTVKGTKLPKSVAFTNIIHTSSPCLLYTSDAADE